MCTMEYGRAARIYESLQIESPTVAAARADKEWTDVKDVADDVGRMQVFPVVCPLSDKKPGIQEPKSWHHIRTRFRQEEEQHEQWSFRRDRAYAELARAAQAASVHRHLAKQAARVAEDAAMTTRHENVEIERAVEIRQRRGELDLQLAKARLEEVKLRLKEAEEESKQRLQEHLLLVQNERDYTSKWEASLQVERERVAEAESAAAAAEEQSNLRIEARAQEVARARLECERRVEQARKVAESRVEAAERRAEADLQAAAARLADVRARCNGRRVQEVARRCTAEELVEERRARAMARGDTDKESMRRFESAAREHWSASVQAVSTREAATSEHVDTKVAATDALVFAAAQKSQAAHRREEWTADSVRHAVHVMKGHQHAQKQMDRIVLTTLSGILQAVSKPAPS